MSIGYNTVDMTIVQDSPQIDASTCSGSLHPEALEGIRYFNHGHFFEAHEALEAAWRQETGPVRELYRGILQVAVAYYHLQRGNLVGAHKLFQRCKKWLDPFPDTCRGVDIAQLRRDYHAVEIMLATLTPSAAANMDGSIFKPIVLID
jgi:uncharacterized protein